MFGDISKTFGRNFLVASFAPMVLLMAANMLLVAAEVLRPVDAKYLTAFGIGEPLVSLAVVAILSVFLQQFSRTLIRVFEGYHGQKFLWLSFGSVGFFLTIDLVDVAAVSWGWISILAIVFAAISVLHIVFARYHRWRYDKWCKKIEELAKTNKRQALTERRDLSRRYPLNSSLILPTRLGNILRSFEHHPRHLYNIAPISGWARLVAVIPDNFRGLIEEQEANVTFLLNVILVILILGCEFFALRSAAPTTLAPLALLTLPTAYIVYRAACSAAIGWGEFVRSAFDLYRLDLLKQLGVHVPPALSPLT
jgi:hypothetical protein